MPEGHRSDDISGLSCPTNLFELPCQVPSLFSMNFGMRESRPASPRDPTYKWGLFMIEYFRLSFPEANLSSTSRQSAFVLAGDRHPRASELLAWVREGLAVNETGR